MAADDRPAVPWIVVTATLVAGVGMAHGNAHGEPLARFRAMHTRDAGEAEHVVSDVYVPHRLTTADVLDARLNVACSGGITIGYLTYGGGARLSIPPMVDAFHLNLTLTGTTMVRQGRAETRTAAGRGGVMLSPDRTSTVEWSGDAGQFAVKVDRRALEEQLSALLNHAVDRPLRFALAVDLGTPTGAALLTAVDFMATQLDLQGPADDLARQHMESFILTQVLLGIPNNYSHTLTATSGPAAHSALHEAIDYIEAHPDRPLGLAELATVAGTSGTALRTAFREELGTTPGEYVRGVRLARAHAELAGVDSDGGSIGAIARRWGFSDQRRFAAEYEAIYGQSPADRASATR
jgi:AraC-like DNA-binding protein